MLHKPNRTDKQELQIRIIEHNQIKDEKTKKRYLFLYLFPYYAAMYAKYGDTIESNNNAIENTSS